MLTIEQFLSRTGNSAVIDVRTPAEFSDGHVVGAHNIPLFENDERAEIGTLYKRCGHDKAVMRGLEIAGPKFADIARTAKKISGRDGCLVYCWRGGMRSESVTWLLRQTGIECERLDGGYKTYRRHVQEVLARQYTLLVLSGMTGSAKTELLQDLRGRGEQVLDLEGLASHRGSAFGGIGLAPQPRVEHFENMMFEELSKLDWSQPIWVEDESRNIGRVYVPQTFFEQMRAAPVLFLDVTATKRARHISTVYGDMPTEELEAAIGRVTKRLGGLRTQQAIAAVAEGHIETAIEILLEYYDKTYSNSSSSRDPQLTTRLAVADDESRKSIADRMLDASEQIMDGTLTS